MSAASTFGFEFAVVVAAEVAVAVLKAGIVFEPVVAMQSVSRKIESELVSKQIAFELSSAPAAGFAEAESAEPKAVAAAAIGAVAERLAAAVASAASAGAGRATPAATLLFAAPSAGSPARRLSFGRSRGTTRCAPRRRQGRLGRIRAAGGLAAGP